MIVREDVPLAPLCTLGVGGPAKYFVTVTTADAVAEALAWARARSLAILVVGGGSNLVIADAGFPGLVIHVALTELAFASAGIVNAGAGVEWDALVAEAVSRGWAGVECLSGIPGRVGATPMQNVGAYGQEVAETIVHVDAVEIASGAPVRLSAADCGFGYRTSRFKTTDRGRYLVTGVSYRLRPGGQPKVAYADLIRELEARRQSSPSVAAVRDAVVAVRRRKSMVVDPADPDSRSVGSFFTNPIVSAAEADQAEEWLRRANALRKDEPLPRYSSDAGVKIPAAWLIERCGFRRGYARGAAGISTRHTLAIVNRGGATAAEVVALAREVRDRVRDRTGVTLVPEPDLVGVTF